MNRNRCLLALGVPLFGVPLFGVVLFGVVLFASGCKSETAAPSAESEVPAIGPAVAEEPEDPGSAPAGQSEREMPEEVSVQILDWDETLGLVARHSGKVVVMDIWATYCPPCVAEFPHLVEIHRDFPGRVQCISVSLDYDGLDDEPAEAHLPRVLRFLERQEATFENILCSTDAETVFNRKMEHNSIPVVYVFDRQGELAGQFPDPKDPAEFTYQEDVLPLVKKLLAND